MSGPADMHGDDCIAELAAVCVRFGDAGSRAFATLEAFAAWDRSQGRGTYRIDSLGNDGEPIKLTRTFCPGGKEAR